MASIAFCLHVDGGMERLGWGWAGGCVGGWVRFVLGFQAWIGFCGGGPVVSGAGELDNILWSWNSFLHNVKSKKFLSSKDTSPIDRSIG